MNKQKKNNLIEAQHLIEKLTQSFSTEEFKELDKMIRDLIDGNLGRVIDKGRRVSQIDDFDKKLEAILDLSVYWWEEEKLVEDFYSLCQKNYMDFYATRTFKIYIRITFLADLRNNSEIEFVDNVAKYLRKANDNYMMINARTAIETINATRLKRYRFYRKVKSILKRYAANYDLSPYEKYIKNKKIMGKVLFFNFIQELNKLKIAEGIIPYEICKYLIHQMLTPNSPIYDDYKFWSDLRECVFCDFMTNIQVKKYNSKDFINCIIKLNEDRGTYNKKRKLVCIDEDVVYGFDDYNIRAIVTTFHELRHFGQFHFSKKDNYHDGKYRILKEDIVLSNYSKFSQKNYWILYKEIDARKYAIFDSIRFLAEIGIDTTELKIKRNSEKMLFGEYCRLELDDCETSFYENSKKLNIQRKLTKTLKDKCELISQNPILKYEFNKDGVRKSTTDIIIGLEKGFIEKNISKETLIDILNFSVFDYEYITKSKTNTNIAVKYKYLNNTFKKICFNALYEKLQLEISRIPLYEDKELAAKVKQCLGEQVKILKSEGEDVL